MTRENRRLDALLAAGAVLVLFFLLGPLLRIPLRLPLGYNEGWNAYLATRAVEPGAGPLYPGPGSLVFDNYPPLSFLVVGALGRLAGGDMIVAGRAVALASLLACAWLLGRCVRLLGGTRRGGVASGLLLLLYAAVAFRRYVGVDEPQWFGHTLALAGLAVLLGGDPGRRFAAGRVVGAAALMTAAGMVKHLLVGLPLAVTLWLALEQRRAAVIWLAAAAVAVAASLALTGLLAGSHAIPDVLHHHRVFRARRVVAAFVRVVPPLAPMLAIALLAVRRRGRYDPATRFAFLFVAVSLVTGLVERAGDGVNYNAHFETLLACCLATGLAVSRRSREARPGPRPGPAAIAAVAALPLAVLAPLASVGAWRDVADSAERATDFRPEIARIAAARGIAGCETLSLCFWAGRKWAVDVFNLEQDIRTGGSIGRFDALAAAHDFGVFEFSAVDLGRDMLALDLLRHGYRPGAAGPGGTVLLSPPGVSSLDNARQSRR